MKTSLSNSSNRLNNSSHGLDSNFDGSVSSSSSNRVKSFRDRCQSPLVLLNNVPPSLDLNSSRLQSPMIQTTEDSSSHPNPFKVWQQIAQSPAIQISKDSPTFAGGQLPKRTVSLGPRRPPPIPPPRAHIGEGLKTNPFLQKKKNISESERKFNNSARELQSSLTDLNNLIESSTPKIMTNNKPPRFTTSFNDIESSSRADSPPSPPRQIQTWNVEEDLQHWKASGSINDLRSMFEKQSSSSNNLKESSFLSATNDGISSQRPPRSASPNFLKNSPWHQNKNPDSQIPPDNRGNSSALNKSNDDYTIRRTISTSSSRTGSNNIRNPYRGRY